MAEDMANGGYGATQEDDDEMEFWTSSIIYERNDTNESI